MPDPFASRTIAARLHTQIARARVAVGLLLGLVLAVCVPATAEAKRQPHVWLHYDYMVYPDGHSAEPDPAAIQRAVDAYAAQGIHLEIDDEHAAIPTSDPLLVLDTNGGSCPRGVSFSALKDKYFKQRSRHGWHYAIFSDQVTSFGNFRESCFPDAFPGVAELPGDDFVIGIETLRHPIPVAEIRATAGTFMHELGHNLNLRHGGDEDLNWKPNYLSVMNHAFQLQGIISDTGRRVDYSGSVLPTMDSDHLNEVAGLGVNSPDWTRFNTGSFFNGSGRIRGPIDWDLDGDATETDVAVTFYDAATGAPLPRFLTGFDDWAAVRAYLGDTRPRPRTRLHVDPVENRPSALGP